MPVTPIRFDARSELKRIVQLLVLFFFIFWGVPGRSQNFCSLICVDSIGLDTLGPNQLQFRIQFQATSSAFINYPLIEAVVNESGDTIGRGALFYFGQFGGTSTIYSASTSLESLPENAASWNLVFRYDSVLCLISAAPCSPAFASEKMQASPLKLFPSPATDMLNFTDFPENISFSIFSVDGKCHYHASSIPPERQIPVHALPEGIYMMKFSDGRQLKFSKKSP